MKLAFSTLGCPDWNFDRILEQAREMGYRAIEVRGIEGEMRADRMRPFLPKNRQRSVKQLQECGLEICSFGASASFGEERRAEALDDGRAAIDLCEQIGIPYVRVFGTKPKLVGSLCEQVKWTAFGARELCDYAGPRGVQILLEVHGWFQTAPRILEVAEQVGRQNFGIVWDVEHSDEANGGDFLPFYRQVRPLIRHVHIKDHQRLPGGDFRLCSVGQGDIPLREMLKQLRSDGYQGACSLEWEKKWHPELVEPEVAFPSYVQWMRENGFADDK